MATAQETQLDEARSQKLIGYLMGASVLASASVSQATILSIDYTPDITATDPDASVQGDREIIDIDLDINGGTFGSTSILTGSPGSGPPHTPPVAPAANHLFLAPDDHWLKSGTKPKTDFGGRVTGANVAYALFVVPGTTIDGTLAWFTDTEFTGELIGSDSILGLQLMDGSDFYYGWLRWSSGSITLQELAFEQEANTPIAAGDTGAPTGEMPVPATLLLMTTGLAGIAAVRRRRKAPA